MGIQHHSVSIHFARTVTDAAKRNNLDYQALLQRAGLNERLLTKPNLRITPAQLSQLMLETMRMADDEFMCMGSQPSRVGVFALMAKMTVRCQNLRSVYHQLSHFYNLVAGALILKLDVDENETTFSLELTNSDMDPDCTLREFLLLIFHRFPSWLIGQRIPLKYITLQCAKSAHQSEHKLMYPCPVKYNQPTNSLVFDSALLKAPVVQTTTTLRAYLRNVPYDWFKRQAYFQTFTRRVLDYLEQDEQHGISNMDEIANELHVTTRTLRRKLIEEGTSFQELKDGVRRDSAIHYLSQGSIPVSEISRKLGFSEPAAFTRAFKQWTGVPPTIYRNS